MSDILLTFASEKGGGVMNRLPGSREILTSITISPPDPNQLEGAAVGNWAQRRKVCNYDKTLSNGRIQQTRVLTLASLRLCLQVLNPKIQWKAQCLLARM